MTLNDPFGMSDSLADRRTLAWRWPDLFVGRDDELAAVLRCAADVEVGRPWVVLVEGPAGVGKSAFVRRAATALTDFGVIEAAADEVASEEPMWLLGQLVPSSSASSPFAAAMGLLSELAERQSLGPVALIIEDLHWADGPSRRALLTVLQRLQGDKVLVFVSARPEGRPDDEAWAKLLDDPQRCLRVGLGALSAADIRDLANRLDVPLGPNAATRLQRHTDGHALWVRTLLRELTPAELNAFGALPAPRSLAATTRERVAALPQASTQLIRALAVVGRPVPLVELGRVAGLTDPTQALDAALSTGFVEWSPLEPASGVRFVHPLFASAVASDIPPLQRRQLHRAAAEANPALALSHRLAAADTADETLAAELDAAAAAASDPSVAARWLVAAAEVSEQPADRARRLLAAGDAHLAIGDVQGLLELQPRLEACPPSHDRDVLLGWIEWQRGDIERAEQLLAAAAEDPDPRVAAAALLQLGSLYGFLGRGRDAIRAGRAALALGCLGPHDEQAAWRVVCSGVGQAEGGAAAVAVLDETFLVPGTDPNDLSQDVQRIYAVSEAGAGRPAAALRWFERMMSQPPQGAEVAHLAHSHMARAMCHFRVGDWDAALLHAHTSIDVAVDEAQRWVLGHVNAVAAWVHAGRGQWEQAERRLQHARAAVEAAPIAFAVIRTRMADAFVGRARGDSAAVVEALSPLATDGGIVVPAMSPLDHWPPLIEAMIDVGHGVEAADQLSRMRRAAAARGIDLRMQELTIEARLSAMAGDASAATAAYEAAVAAAGPESDFLDQLELRCWFGRHLRALGRRREAIVQLSAAHALATAAGAAPFIERVTVDLRGSEATVPPARSDPFGTLTARERDVVTLVAAGSTNREAATSLYVSVKAVEYHLGNIYAKLHIASRRELKALVTAA